MINIDDNFQKQLLLKNAEIRALRSQMDPHFLFNVLNTIAWKAQIINNEEIYQMVISLGELLKANTPSKETDFIELEQETEYVKFYIYLQQRRFEDRIDCVIRIPEELMKCMVPCFCIQPLVENAIVHGLEPKRGKGKLIIQIFPTDAGDSYPAEMEVVIIDNGVGFADIPDIRSIPSSAKAAQSQLATSKRRQKIAREENAFLKEQFLQVMTDHSYRPPFEEKLRTYGICLDRYHVAAFQLIPYHDDISSLKKIIIDEKENAYCYRYNNLIITVYFDGDFDRILQNCNEIKTIMRTLDSREISVGISRLHTGPSSFRQAVSGLFFAIRDSLYDLIQMKL